MRSLPELLKKYDVAGPRYTSYPTIPVWTTEVNAKDYQESLMGIKRQPGSNAHLLSLYFHLPFCENLCHFCGCMKVITTQHKKSKEYVEVLLKEIDRVASCVSPESREVSQVHFGGGTPNFLKPEELQHIVDRVHKHFSLLPSAEVAIEMHPRTSTPAFCEMLAKLGFNRISLGVQDFDPHVQKLINRHQTYEITSAMLSLLRKLGFQSFNFDLIYGLPGQTVAGWKKTLDQVLHLHPDRLAVYSYAHVPWLKSYQRSFEDKDLPSPEKKIELFEQAYQTLTQNGYRSIGMDHFALENDDLSKALKEGTIHRNFMGYSTQSDVHQLGFGVSAISYVGGNYFQNQKDLSLYDQNILREETLATFRGFLLTHDDALRRDLITQIMCCGKIDIQKFEKKWNIRFLDDFQEEWARLKDFVEDGLLILSPSLMEVKGEGFLFLRNMAMVFDRYLKKIQENAANPVFSRTV